MDIIELKEKKELLENNKLSGIYVQFQELLKELRKKGLPHKISELVNQDIEELNSSSFADNELNKILKKKQAKILKLLETELKIVPKGHYKNFWLAIGMCVFGLPIGTVFGIISDNMGLIGIGLPIGIAIGIVLGSNMDKKAFEEGRQLEVKIQY